MKKKILITLLVLIIVFFAINYLFFSYGTVKVATKFNAVVFEIDGRVIEKTAPFEIKLKKGKHTIKATSIPSVEPFEETFSLKRNETKNIEVIFVIPEEDSSADPALLP